jgi:tRNA(fMet)-specific endonuclease VapC
MNPSANYLVDTDIIIYWLTSRYLRIHQKIEEIRENRIFLSSITIAELYFGAYNSSRPVKNCKLIDELVLEMNVIPFNEKTGGVFGRIKTELKKKGEIINDSDLFIAATAISRNLILVTNNEEHFKRIDDLKIENWT